VAGLNDVEEPLRSTDTILPHISYKNVPEAITWLTNAFGFTEHYRYGDPVAGAQMSAGDAWIMLNSAQARRASPAKAGWTTPSLTIFVDDVAAHFGKVKAFGCKITEDIHETVYGELHCCSARRSDAKRIAEGT
jgi:uncharacterized glyoxalase superfamily protein PhnB